MRVRNFNELRARMSPKAKAKAAAKTAQLLRELPLNELRQARQLTQETLAATLQVKQASISKMERSADMYVSTLRKFIEAMGGHLQIRACFPEGDVQITSLAGEPAARVNPAGKASFPA